MKILHISCPHHIGDVIILLIVLYNIKKNLELENTTVFLYIQNEHINQIKDFNPINNMKFLDINTKPNNSIELWDCNDWYFSKITNNTKPYSGYSQNRYYIKYFNIRLKIFNIPGYLTHYCYEDNDLLVRYNNLENKYKNLDILIINSTPMSSQFFYDENKWNNAIKFLSTKYNIVTTKKIDGVLSTLDNNLFLKDIAALSTNVKVVIAINTGPFMPLLNKITLTKVKKFYIFVNRSFYDYPNFEIKQRLRDISLEELDKYIKS